MINQNQKKQEDWKGKKIYYQLKKLIYGEFEDFSMGIIIFKYVLCFEFQYSSTFYFLFYLFLFIYLLFIFIVYKWMMLCF